MNQQMQNLFYTHPISVTPPLNNPISEQISETTDWLKPRTSSEFTQGDRGPSVWTIIQCLPECIAKLHQKLSSQNFSGHSDMGCEGQKLWLNPLVPQCPLKNYYPSHIHLCAFVLIWKLVDSVKVLGGIFSIKNAFTKYLLCAKAWRKIRIKHVD